MQQPRFLIEHTTNPQHRAAVTAAAKYKTRMVLALLGLKRCADTIVRVNTAIHAHARTQAVYPSIQVINPTLLAPPGGQRAHPWDQRRRAAAADAGRDAHDLVLHRLLGRDLHRVRQSCRI